MIVSSEHRVLALGSRVGARKGEQTPIAREGPDILGDGRHDLAAARRRKRRRRRRRRRRRSRSRSRSRRNTNPG